MITSAKASIFFLVIFMIACKSKNTVEDIDGNIYRTVKIGNQVWMSENLRVTKYKNGDSISNMKDEGEWKNALTGAFCNYGNETPNAAAYGALYNWFAVNDIRGIAPEGWHIPTEAELDTLIKYLKGDTIAAGKLKERGVDHWLNTNSTAEQETGFSAIASGYRFADGTFHTKGSNGYWWLNHSSFEMYAWTPRLFKSFADVFRSEQYKNYGFAVRCIKD